MTCFFRRAKIFFFHKEYIACFVLFIWVNIALSDSKSDSIVSKNVSRRNVLKWSGALAAAGIVGVGLGFGGDLLLRPSTTKTTTQIVTQTGSTATETATQTITTSVTATSPPITTTITATTTASQGEQVFYHLTDGSGALQVHVANGRIIRIRPAQFDPADLTAGAWSLNIGGQTYTPPKPSASTFVLASKRRVYSPLRIMYPMQRVDFDPSGDRHPETRGVSEYVRVTWNKPSL